ncbi:9026_t:CDS:2 [Funneliformis geosporum]|uniref:9026_t:CDS:1 n=1 Tax=Funneliformis geosporum TaxID=1117311 RepID=A0A9W4T5L0_9GLOM|nr:9026_t:CDS:2 [Funneliformis geosporum]
MLIKTSEQLPSSYSLPPPPPPNPQLSSQVNGRGKGRGRGRGYAHSQGRYYNAQDVTVSQYNYQSNYQRKWRCEPCVKSFAHEAQLKYHMNLHRKCDHCEFSAMTNILKTHLFEVHKLGSNPMKSDESLKAVMDFHLDTPEAIAKWIEQRKKNYPTDVNIERKKKLEAARMARGKVLKSQAQKKQLLYYANGKKDDIAIKKRRFEFGGRNTKFGDHNEDAGPCGITDFSTGSKKDQINGRLYRQICIKYRQGHCPRGKNCTNKHAGKMICPPIQRPPDHARCRQRNLRDLLLYKEFVEEKNVILQCIRHIANKKFFGVVTNKSIRDAKKRGEALVVEVNSNQAPASTPGKTKKSKHLIKQWSLNQTG